MVDLIPGCFPAADFLKSLRNSPWVTTGIMEGIGAKIQGLRATLKPLGRQMKLAMVLSLALGESLPA